MWRSCCRSDPRGRARDSRSWAAHQFSPPLHHCKNFVLFARSLRHCQGSACQRQAVRIEFTIARLLRANPRLVPRDVDTCDQFVRRIDPERPRIGKHVAESVGLLRFRLRWGPAIRRDNGKQPATRMKNQRPSWRFSPGLRSLTCSHVLDVKWLDNPNTHQILCAHRNLQSPHNRSFHVAFDN